jgi:hypothetical protein
MGRKELVDSERSVPCLGVLVVLETGPDEKEKIFQKHLGEGKGELAQSNRGPETRDRAEKGNNAPNAGPEVRL